jgi:pyridoxamine 5'-phosphate oxidase
MNVSAQGHHARNACEAHYHSNMTQSETDWHCLSPEVMADAPMEQFSRWMAEAGGLPEPTAMVLATTSADGRPRARTVLLKAHGDEGFTFYTNRTSRKGQDLAASPHACLVFPWYPLQRQVTVEGTVAMASQADSEAYFRSRPRGSQLSAWASRQSTVLESRAQLDGRAAELERRWPPGTDVPMPDFWRGYLLTPETVEFWQAGQYRRHDRLRYRRDGVIWVIERLSP